MKIKFKGKELANALKTIASVTGHTNVTMVAGKKFKLSAQGKTKTLTLILPGVKVEDKGTLTIELAMLSQLIASRGDCSLAMDEPPAVKVTAKGLNAELIAMPEEEIPAFAKAEGFSIGEKEQEVFASALETVSLHDAYHQSPVAYSVSFGKRLVVKGFDRHHIAVCTAEIKSKAKASFQLPSEVFSTVSGLAGKAPYTLAFSDGECFAENEGFQLRMPLTIESEATNNVTDESVVKILDAVSQAKPEGWAEVIVADLTKAVGEVLAIYEQEASPLHIFSKGEQLVLKYKTNYGSVSSLIAAKVKGKFDVHVDIPVLNDTIAKCPGTTIKLHAMEKSIYGTSETETLKAQYLVNRVSS